MLLCMGFPKHIAERALRKHRRALFFPPLPPRAWNPERDGSLRQMWALISEVVVI